jgi:hypothetical protein
MKKQIISAVVAIGASMSTATGALAQSQQEQQACTHDAFQFCAELIPDRSRVFNCLVAKKDVISAACRTVMAPYLPSEAAVQKAALRTPSAKGKEVRGGQSSKAGKGAKSTQTGKSTSSKTTKLATTAKISKSTTSSSRSKRVKAGNPAKTAKAAKAAKTAKTAKNKGPLDLRPH